MRLLLQRVTRADVRVEGAWSGSIGPGLRGARGRRARGQRRGRASRWRDRTVDLRIFRDEEGRTNRSLLDVGGELLAISQFTLYADTRKGRRPSFLGAAPPEQG